MTENAPERYLAPVGFPYGAAHESEVQYLFSLANTPFPGVLTGGAAATGRGHEAVLDETWPRPDRPTARRARWPRFTGTSQQMLSLVPPRPRVETGFAAEHHCAFWAAAG